MIGGWGLTTPFVQRIPNFNGRLSFALPYCPALARVDSSKVGLHGILTTLGSWFQGSVDKMEVMISRNPSKDLDKKPTEEECVVWPGFYWVFPEWASFFRMWSQPLGSYRIGSISVRKSVVAWFDGKYSTKCGRNSDRTSCGLPP